eukprot:6459567-Amphidinium_carterae.1
MERPSSYHHGCHQRGHLLAFVCFLSAAPWGHYHLMLVPPLLFQTSQFEPMYHYTSINLNATELLWSSLTNVWALRRGYEDY